MQEEGSELREWRRLNAIRLAEKKKKEEEMKNQIIEEAQEFKQALYEKIKLNIESNKTTNRENEKLFLANQEKIDKETDRQYWKAIAELIPNEVPTIEKRGKKEDQDKRPSVTVVQGPKPGKPTDLSRLRGILAKLKHHTPPHMLPSTAPKATAEPSKGKSISWKRKVLRSAVLLPDKSESKYLSDFEELAFIGDGGFGVIAKCRNNIDERFYAVKKVSISLSDTTFAKLVREVHALSRMKHRNVVQYYQAWVESRMSGLKSYLKKKDVESPCLYILMELCSMSLAELIYKEKQAEFISKEQAEFISEEPVNVFRQILDGVQHIHSRGFIHGDLSLGNIFVDEDCVVKIGDFGLARRLHDEEQTAYSNDDGNAVYRAPEKKAGQLITTKSDMFSLGIILMELRHKFTTLSERHKVLEDVKNFIIAPEYESEFSPLIKRLVAVTPSDRPDIPEVVAELNRLNI